MIMIFELMFFISLKFFMITNTGFPVDNFMYDRETLNRFVKPRCEIHLIDRIFKRILGIFRQFNHFQNISFSGPILFYFLLSILYIVDFGICIPFENDLQ
jgi:hypothetical protein